tara:strand:- start:3568 stop:3909 length:342 start_codon:yes stop_codon:yes gene_type:complete
MNKYIIINLIELLSLTLILSYFFINNIILVQGGIALSLYLINVNFINNLVKSIKRNLIRGKTVKETNKKDELIYINTKEDRLNKEIPRLTLVETIEELGFIPSPDKSNESDVA